MFFQGIFVGRLQPRGFLGEVRNKNFLLIATFSKFWATYQTFFWGLQSIRVSFMTPPNPWKKSWFDPSNVDFEWKLTDLSKNSRSREI